MLPTRAYDGDAGLDLYAAHAAASSPASAPSVGTGIAVAIPAGHAGLVLPRSGLAARHGIALVNAPGLIDAGYRGELRVLLLNTDREAAFEIAAGDRIAQLLVVAFAPRRRRGARGARRRASAASAASARAAEPPAPA